MPRVFQSYPTSYREPAMFRIRWCLCEFEALAAMLHLTEAMRAKIEALRMQRRGRSM
jgi:hypothetical protein